MISQYRKIKKFCSLLSIVIFIFLNIFSVYSSEKGQKKCKQMYAVDSDTVFEKTPLSAASHFVNIHSMDDARDPNLLNMLSGKVPGMRVISGGSSLSSTGIILRGHNFLNGNNQPLFLIDGCPIINVLSEKENFDYGVIMSLVNPDEIESIEVLNGINAALIYGSDAVNGTVLIRTKRASRKEGLGISYGFNMMFENVREYPAYQDVYGRGNKFRLPGTPNLPVNTNPAYDQNYPYGIYGINMKSSPYPSWGMPYGWTDIVGVDGKVRPYNAAPETLEDLFRRGQTITNSVSVDKQLSKAAFRLSYTNICSSGVMKSTNEFKRHNLNLSTQVELAKFLELDVNARYMTENVDDREYRSISDRNPLSLARFINRDITLNEMFDDDDHKIPSEYFKSQYWLLDNQSNNDNKSWFSGNLAFNIKLPYNINFRLLGAVDSQRRKAWASSTSYNSSRKVTVERYSDDITSGYFDAFLSYQGRWKKWNLNIGVGGNAFRSMNEFSTIFDNDYFNVEQLDNESWRSSKRRDEQQSFYGMLNVNFDNWLYLDFATRREWNDEKLTYRDKQSFNYSVGGNLVLSNLLKINTSVLSFAALKGSYARMGYNLGVQNMIEFKSYTDSEYNLKHPHIYSWEAGLAVRFWDNRIRFDYTYYHKRSLGQLMWENGEIKNWGELRNKGSELVAEIVPVQNKWVTWTSSFIWAKNKSKLKSHGIPELKTLVEQFYGRVFLGFEAGKPYGTLSGSVYKRNEQGQILVDSQGIPLSEGNVYYGSVEPDWFGSWRNSLKIWHFDLDILFDFQKGGHLWSFSSREADRLGLSAASYKGRNEYMFSSVILGEDDNERRGYLSPSAVPAGLSAYYIDKDRPKGLHIENSVYHESAGEELAGRENTTWVSPEKYYWNTSAEVRDAQYFYDTSFIKLREINIGFNFPDKWLRKTPLKSVRIAAVGRNIATLFQNTPDGIDPQATITVSGLQGFEDNSMFPTSSWGFDIKFSF